MGRFRTKALKQVDKFMELRDAGVNWEYAISFDKPHFLGFENRLYQIETEINPLIGNYTEDEMQILLEAYSTSEGYENVKLVRREIGDWKDA